MRSLVLVALAGAALGIVPAAGALPLTVIGTAAAPTKVSAAAGWTGWSDRVDGRWVLVLRAPDGTVAKPAVAPRGVPFDLDLGVGATGAVVAAYSRCAKEPRTNRGTPLPVWTSGAGCRLYRLDVATGAETKLAAQPGTSSQVLPSIGGGTLAFVGKPSASRDRRQAVLYVRDLKTRKTVRAATRPRRDGSDPWGPEAVDTDGVRVALNWHELSTEAGSSYDSEVALWKRGGKAVDLSGLSQSESCQGQVHGAAVSGTRALWLATSPSRWVVEGQAPKAKPVFGPSNLDEAGTDVDGPESDVVSAAFDGARVVVAETTDGATARIREVPLGQLASGKLPDDIPSCA